MSEIEYYKDSMQSRKDKFATAVLLLFSAIAIILWYDKTFVIVAATGTFLVGLYLAKSVFSKKPTVIVNVSGIRTNVNGIGLVSWLDIASFERIEGPNAEFIKVVINNNDELLSKKSGLAKVFMKSNIKALGSPVVIPQQEFGKPLNEVLTELNSARTTYNNM